MSSACSAARRTRSCPSTPRFLVCKITAGCCRRVRVRLGPFDSEALSYQWAHDDTAMDELCDRVQALVAAEERRKSSRRAIFARIWELAQDHPLPASYDVDSRRAVPSLSEGWYCCAEPTAEQLAQI